MPYCYILHSKKLDKFYIGATRNGLEKRLQKHLSQYYGTNHFTAKTNDWTLFLKIETPAYNQALKIEKAIKSKKSAVFIRNLNKYPELLQKTIKSSEIKTGHSR